MHSLRRRLALASVLLMATSAACGASTPAGPTPQEQAAEAKKKQDAADEAALAERKVKREAEEAAKAKAEAELAAELERLCVAPEKLPKDPVAACEAVGTALDAYIRRVSDAEAIAAWDAGGKEKAVPMAVVQCTQADSVKTAACQKGALDNAGPELKDQTRKIMQLCIDKFASPKRGAAPGMPKRRPG